MIVAGHPTPSYPLGGRADILLHARVGWPTGYSGSAGRKGNVRRIFGYVVFTLGWLFVFLAPLLYLYTKPRVEKAPNDVYEVTRSFGSGRIFSAKSFHVEGPMPVENVSIARSDTEASSKRVAVISIFQRTINLQTGGDIDYQF